MINNSIERNEDIMKIIELNESTKKNIMEDLLKRSPNQYEEIGRAHV